MKPTIVEFGNEYGLKTITKNPSDKLYNYQENFLNFMQEDKYLMVLTSRQMGGTMCLAIHIAYFLLFNEGERNQILLTAPKQDNAKQILNMVKVIIQVYNNNSVYKVKTSCELQLQSLRNKLNSVKIIASEGSLREANRNKIYELIVDEAAFCPELDRILNTILNNIDNSVNKEIAIILISNKSADSSCFLRLFNQEGDSYHKIKLHYSLNPTYTEERVKYLEETLGQGVFNREFEMIDVDVKDNIAAVSTNLTKIVPIRLNDSQLNKITHKLIERDITISQYIRDLIDKD
jgi:hypothetical protein